MLKFVRILPSLSIILLPSYGFATTDADRYLTALKIYSERQSTASVANVASGFGVQGGAGFVAVSYSNQDLQTDQAGDDDGSMIIGLGLGDPDTGIGIEASIGITSVSTPFWGDGKFGDEGNVNIKLHRSLPNFGGTDLASISVGASNLMGWGSTVENPTNTYFAYSGIHNVGIYKQYSFGYTIGWGSAVANTESEDSIFYGAALARSSYNMSIGVIGSERHFTLSWQPDFLRDVSISYTRVVDQDLGFRDRDILSMGYAFRLWSSLR